jgi:hypothetical protein
MQTGGGGCVFVSSASALPLLASVGSKYNQSAGVSRVGSNPLRWIMDVVSTNIGNESLSVFENRT